MASLVLQAALKYYKVAVFCFQKYYLQTSYIHFIGGFAGLGIEITLDYH